jgi:hypothetical protein
MVSRIGFTRWKAFATLASVIVVLGGGATACRDGINAEAADDGGFEGGFDGAVAEGPVQGRALSANGVAVASFSLSSNDVMAFPSVPCGGAATTNALSITNEGSVVLSVSAATTGGAFSVSPMVLQILPGTAGTLVVSAVAPASAPAGEPLTGALTLSTNDPSQKSVIYQLNATPRGATLAIPQGSFVFPPTHVGTALPAIVRTLSNTGNAPATFTFSTPTSSIFSFLGAADGGVPPVALNPGETWQVSALFTPTSPTVFTASSTITASAATCGESQTSIAFSGEGATGDVQGWPTAPIDFGAAICGGGAPAPQTFTLTNAGLVYAKITSVSLTGAPGFAAGINVGRTIAANASFVVTLTAPPVPLNTSTTPVTGTLSIETDADTSPHLITLTEEPSGALLSWNTSAIPNFGSFGPVQLLGSATQSFRVVNSGTAPASVTLAVPSNGDAGSSSAFRVAPAAFTVGTRSAQAASVTFSPSAVPGVTGSIAMSATGSICGALPAPLSLSGSGLGGGPVVTSSSLTFGATCGGQAPAAQSFMIENVGTEEFTWAMGGPTGEGAFMYTVTSNPPPSRLLPGASAVIVVGAQAIPSPATDPSPSAYAAQLTITTDVPLDPPHVVSLGETPLGDQLAFSTSGPLSFGQVPLQTMLSQPFSVTNSANAGSPAATVSFALSGTSADGYITPAPLSNLAPGSALTDTLTFFPTSAVPYSAMVAAITTDPLCTLLPSPVPVSGTGTQGVVSVSAATLSFGTDPTDPQGLVNCGAQGLTNSFTVANLGNAPFQITGLVFGKGAASPYALSGPGTALPLTIPIGGASTIVVTPSPIPANVANPSDPTAFSDVLTLATNAAGDVPHEVALTMQPRGAVIANIPLTTAWAFGTVSFGSIGTFLSSIQNTGNAGASIALIGLSQPTIFGLQNNPTIAPGGAMTPIVGQFTPPAASGHWTDSGTLVVSTLEAFCAPVPTEWTSPAISVSGASP